MKTTNNSLIQDYRHIGIVVKDMNESLKFYHDILNLKIIQNFFDDSEYINEVLGLKNAKLHMVKLKTINNITIELIQYLTHPTKIQDVPFFNTGVCHFALQVKNIEKLYNNFIQSGVEFVNKPLLSSEKFAKVCFCTDPNNVRIELVEIIT